MLILISLREENNPAAFYVHKDYLVGKYLLTLKDVPEDVVWEFKDFMDETLIDGSDSSVTDYTFLDTLESDRIILRTRMDLDTSVVVSLKDVTKRTSFFSVSYLYILLTLTGMLNLLALFRTDGDLSERTLSIAGEPVVMGLFVGNTSNMAETTKVSYTVKELLKLMAIAPRTPGYNRRAHANGEIMMQALPADRRKASKLAYVVHATDSSGGGHTSYHYVEDTESTCELVELMDELAKYTPFPQVVQSWLAV